MPVHKELHKLILCRNCGGRIYVLVRTFFVLFKVLLRNYFEPIRVG
jgi:hypothetical protein